MLTSMECHREKGILRFDTVSTTRSVRTMHRCCELPYGDDFVAVLSHDTVRRTVGDEVQGVGADIEDK